MVTKGDTPYDPRGLIYEAYRIEGISSQDCRTIFFDWALGLPAGVDLRAAAKGLLAHYAKVHPDHPMTVVLKEVDVQIKRPARRIRDRRET